ncbi:MAG: phosphate-binding protein [Anaerolinea sp.]|nr:phosphate-binding protein [Anaerolinea sp.]
MSIHRKIVMLLILLLMAGCSPVTSDESGDSSAPAVYIENKGSDTMVNLALAWAEAYQQAHPEVQVSVTGGGSGTGIAALLNGTVSIANASRAIKAEEVDTAKASGVEPVEFVVARDAIAVIVNPQNPINQLTLQQISDIYSGKINNWSELGGEDRPIVRLSRETNSGTHVYFLETVLRLGDKKSKILFSMDTLLLPSSEGITAEVRDNPNAIGYDGLGYIIPEVKMLAVAKTGDGSFVLPSVASVNDGTYPVSRDLYMYTDGQPEGGLKQYLDWIVGLQAQDIVTKLGFVPVAAQ